jgi:hypothetical protein
MLPDVGGGKVDLGFRLFMWDGHRGYTLSAIADNGAARNITVATL